MNKRTNIRPFKTKKSILKAQDTQGTMLEEPVAYYQVNDSYMHRIGTIRKGVSYEELVHVGDMLDIPVKSVLTIVGIPQTSYNKGKREHALLSSRDSELVLSIKSLVTYGTKVFNNEEDKFHRWLKKPNISLGGETPTNLLDTITGIQEIRNCLDRIEYGNFS